MIKDDEQHANDDAKKKELVETRNLAEGMITSTDKIYLNDHQINLLLLIFYYQVT